MGRQGPRLTQLDREHVNGKENKLILYKYQCDTIHNGYGWVWKNNVRVCGTHYSADRIVNTFSATDMYDAKPQVQSDVV